MRLFEPITIRGMTIKNRILMSSMGMGLGYTNHRVREFYVERARGGVGAISIGAGIPDLFVRDDAWGKAGSVRSFIQRLQVVNEAIRNAGAKVGIQFYYGNRYPFALDPRVGELVAPSARVEPQPSRSAWVQPGDRLRELTIQEIETISDTFGKAAAGAKESGFDFVEIHNAHGLLPCQFFSPTTNRRTDKYGGDLQRRMQFGLECVRAMRAAVGDDYPLFARHGAADAVPDGFGVTEGVAFAVELEKAGIDVLDVSIGTPPFQGGYVPAGEDAEGTHVHLAAAIKKAVNIPVAAVGRIKTPEFAEAILAEGRADIVAVGRQLIADPYWPAKVAAGKAAEIVPCIDCHECYGRSTAGNGVECTANVRAGHEAEPAVKAADHRKRVLVIGGGPAGMEAARVAAARGHQVVLRDSARQLGGAMLLQAVIPYKDRVDDLVLYMTAQLLKEGVKVELGKTVTPEVVAQLKADVVIVATGAKPLKPDIPGIDRANVISSGAIRGLISGEGLKSGSLRSGWRGMLIRVGSLLLRRELSLPHRKQLAGLGIPLMFGKRVAIIGADLTACQLADLLAAHGRQVTMLTTEQNLASDMVSTLRQRLLKRLADRGVCSKLGVMNYDVITAEGIVVTNRQGIRETVVADTVIPMLGFKANDELAANLRNMVPEIHIAGDCAEPLKLLHAVHDGARIGREI